MGLSEELRSAHIRTLEVMAALKRENGTLQARVAELGGKAIAGRDELLGGRRFRFFFPTPQRESRTSAPLRPVGEVGGPRAYSV